ncbi:MAG: 4-hydroxy-tetrahydrodipicolinate synthase, partial [Thermodesulfobacteriota bacterium]
ETAAGRVPVIAGTGSNSTSETVMLTKHALKAGADAALLITPYYNKPTQRGLLEHYRHVAGEVDIPLILYNVPSRTGLNMLPETVARLSEEKNVAGIKEATADLEQISEIIKLSQEGFCVLSGDDATTLPLIAVGGRGVISVVSNVAPADMAEMCSLALSGKTGEARKLHYKLLPLTQALFVETNPIPVKTALALMGKAGEEFRLPLVTMAGDNRRRVEDALRAYGLI